MRKSVVDSGNQVVNVIEAPVGFVLPGYRLKARGEIGDRYDGNTLIKKTRDVATVTAQIEREEAARVVKDIPRGLRLARIKSRGVIALSAPQDALRAAQGAVRTYNASVSEAADNAIESLESKTPAEVSAFDVSAIAWPTKP